MSAGGSSDEGHSQLQGWDGSWIWVQLVTFLGCSFCFPARSAQRWRRWQLHGSAVPVAAVRPREELPQPGASGCSLALNPLGGSPGGSWQRQPLTALGDRSQPSSFFGRFCSCGSLGAPGVRGCPRLPLPLQPKRPRCHRCSSVVSCPVSPSRALGAQSLHPGLCCRESSAFPARAAILAGLAGVRAAGCPWGGGWVPPRLAEQQFQDRTGSHPVGL